MNITKELFSGRLKELLGEDRGAKTRLAKVCHVKHAVAARWYDGEALPNLQGLALIAEGTHCNLNWLLYGEGEIYSHRAEPAEVSEAVLPYKRPLPFPVISHASANPHGTTDWEDVKHESVEVPPHAELVKIEDDSMSPVILPGQYVWIDREATIRQNDLVVVKVKGHAGRMFKRISYDPQTDMLALSSANQSGPIEPIIVKRDKVREIFLVIGGWYVGKRRPGRIIKLDQK